jgi:hypothetical protein
VEEADELGPVEVIDPNAERVEERGARAALGAEEAAGVPAEEVDGREGGGEGQDGEREQVAHPSWQSWQEQGEGPGRATGQRSATCGCYASCSLAFGRVVLLLSPAAVLCSYAISVFMLSLIMLNYLGEYAHVRRILRGLLGM